MVTNGFASRTLVGTMVPGLRPVHIIRFICAASDIYDGYLTKRAEGYMFSTGDMYIDIPDGETIKEINVCITYPTDS